jgi:HSP20 family protein
MNSLVKKNGQLASSMPSLLNDFFADDFFRLPFMQWRSDTATTPAVNVKETPDDYQIELAAPGMKRDDFKVELDNDVLSISSERDDQQEENDHDGTFARREFTYKGFRRSFTLDSKKIEGDKIQAQYIDGILLLTIPKKAEARRKPAKQIKID